MKNLSKTLFIPLYFRYKESIGQKAIYDEEAVTYFNNSNILDLLDFSIFDKDEHAYIGTLARTKIVDDFLLELLKKPIDNIFNIGCGLDFRNRRLKIEKNWYNIDLASVIQLRRATFSTLINEKDIEANILESKKWDFISNEINIFILEGVSMYLEEKELIDFINDMCNFSKKAYFIIETAPFEATQMQHPSVKSLDNKIVFKWGTNDIEKFAKNAGIKCLKSLRHVDVLKERWTKNPNEPEFVKILKNNYRISLFENYDK